MARKKWKVGEMFWRGYARSWDGGVTHFPEIRPGVVRRLNYSDGTYECHMTGTMPGTEGKRNPGAWIAFALDPLLMLKTPEAALKQAKQTCAILKKPKRKAK